MEKKNKTQVFISLWKINKTIKTGYNILNVIYFEFEEKKIKEKTGESILDTSLDILS